MRDRWNRQQSREFSHWRVTGLSALKIVKRGSVAAGHELMMYRQFQEKMRDRWNGPA
jgi:hypothetical protein